jgi:hypothetical protein
VQVRSGESTSSGGPLLWEDEAAACLIGSPDCFVRLFDNSLNISRHVTTHVEVTAVMVFPGQHVSMGVIKLSELPSLGVSPGGGPA